MEWCDDGRVLKAYGRDRLNDNGKRMPTFASENKRALTNVFSTRTGGSSHAFNRISCRNDENRIHYILTREAHRPPVFHFKVHRHPPPPAKAD